MPMLTRNIRRSAIRPVHSECLMRMLSLPHLLRLLEMLHLVVHMWLKHLVVHRWLKHLTVGECRV